MSDIKKFSKALLLLLIIIVFACSKDRSPEQDSAFTYFPLSLGQSKEYDVEHTLYSLSSLPETQHFTTKQVISDTFKTVDNQLAFKIEHFTQTTNTAWKLDSISSAWQTFDKVLTQENGQVIVNMIYPLSNGLVWNGNSFNTKSKSFFRVVDLGKEFQNKSLSFPNTVTIIRQDDSTLLSRNTYIEVYALKVGLIKREKTYLQYCSDPDCLGKGIINYGWKELSIIKNYGK